MDYNLSGMRTLKVKKITRQNGWLLVQFQI